MAKGLRQFFRKKGFSIYTYKVNDLQKTNIAIRKKHRCTQDLIERTPKWQLLSEMNWNMLPDFVYEIKIDVT